MSRKHKAVWMASRARNKQRAQPQSNTLPNDIERGQESEETANNAVIEIFVHREAKHGLALRVAL